MTMNRILILVIALFFLGACASSQVKNSELVSSLNVGVQESAGITKEIVASLFLRQNTESVQRPYSIEYKTLDELILGLNMGGIDLAVGQLEVLQARTKKDLKLFAEQQVLLRFFYFPTDNELADISDSSVFFAKLKSVGYVSSGYRSGLNNALISNHPRKYRFEPCGSIEQCIDMLSKNKIDAFASTDPSLVGTEKSGVTSTGSLFTSRYFESSTLGLAMNPVSLSVMEIQQLAELFLLIGNPNKVDIQQSIVSYDATTLIRNKE